MRTIAAAWRRLVALVVVPLRSTELRLKIVTQGGNCGRRLRVSGPVELYIHRLGSISVGNDCRLNSGFRNNPVGSESSMAIWVNANARLRIEDSAGISNSTIVCFERITIGEAAFIGGGCRIYDTDFHSIDADSRTTRTGGAPTAPVVIGARAFLGAHSIVLKGCAIGSESVVGAGSVVTRSIPAREIWGGNPARLIKRLE